MLNCPCMSIKKIIGGNPDGEKLQITTRIPGDTMPDCAGIDELQNGQNAP